MNKKVTIQDIADALGISRNTVSKAINNSEGIADSTKERILKKAMEMGYKQFSYVSSLTLLNTTESVQERIPGEIALFTTAYLGYSHFAATLIDRIQEELSQMGYALSIHRVSKDDIPNRTLPKTFIKDRTNAIICAEVFDADYSDMICELGIPVLFLDGPTRKNKRAVHADMLLMDNMSEITNFIEIMLSRGLRKIGFIGDYEHCQSFWERYCAFRIGMIIQNAEIEERFVLNYPDTELDVLADKLDSLEEMPDVFICANDFVAIDAMRLLAIKDRKLLNKVRFLGFDDSHESRIFYPALSTVHIHSQAMAFSALHLLMTRIEEPSMEFRTIYVETDLILRDSTEF